MIIGIFKEIKDGEFRAALSPRIAAARMVLTSSGQGDTQNFLCSFRNFQHQSKLIAAFLYSRPHYKRLASFAPDFEAGFGCPSGKSPKMLHGFLVEHGIEAQLSLSAGGTEGVCDEYHRKLQPLMPLTLYVFKSMIHW